MLVTCQVCGKKKAVISVDLRVCEDCDERFEMEDLNADIRLVPYVDEIGNTRLEVVVREVEKGGD